MKKILFFLSFYISQAYAHTGLEFNHKFIECENKWVAVKTGSDTSLSYGFVYVDDIAGFTFNLEGSFTIEKDGRFVPKKSSSISIHKYRLKPNNTKVAFIPTAKYGELEIQEYPDWLKHYMDDTVSASHFYHRGFIFNGFNECAKALTYLEKARKMDPKFKGLAVELAFSYNCLSQYNQAILILQEALETNPTDAYVYKELIFAQIHAQQIDKAVESCKKAIAVCNSVNYHAENCYNILYIFYKNKDKKRFDEWLPEAQKWTAKNARLTELIKKMEADLGQ